MIERAWQPNSVIWPLHDERIEILIVVAGVLNAKLPGVIQS